MNRQCPRFVVAALRGGAGKTTLSVAMAVALRKQGIAGCPFQKGTGLYRRRLAFSGGIRSLL